MFLQCGKNYESSTLILLEGEVTHLYYDGVESTLQQTHDYILGTLVNWYVSYLTSAYVAQHESKLS